VPDISSEYDYFGSLDDIKEIINSLSYISKSLIVQTKTLNISQRPPRLCNYLKSLLPLWCLPNIPLNDISSPFLCLKVSKENLKFSLNYVLTNSRSNNDDIDTINKYESLISPKSKKLIAKSIFRV